jgi:pyruvate dehydrogenase E2 component (dihydrolipoamide acetyltransferase)
MAKPINMPKLSDEMTEGKVSQWLKKEGEEVKPGDVVAQVETEKATLDIEAFEAGVLLGIAVREGETAPVGTAIAWVGARGEEVPSPRPRGSPDATEETISGGEISQPSRGPSAPPPSGAPSRGASPPPPDPRPSGASPPPPPRSAGAPLRGVREVPRSALARQRQGGRVVASPAASKAARERGVDLGAVPGSGPGGRIVLADLERAPAPGRERPGPTAPARRRRELPPRATLRDESIPLSPMRKAIVRNLGQAKPGAPHFYLEISADMRRAVALREQLNELGNGQISMNDLVVKAVADALGRHPEVNAAWAGESIERRGGIHVGVAVALDDGLVTPVIRDADRLSVFEVARLAGELAWRARERRLKPDEYQGASFTVSNLGMFGIEAFYAIVNPPQAAILSVGAVQRVPWVDEASGEVVAMERCRFGLSGDHRVVDGATGARFLRTFQGVIESPVRLVVP